MQNVADMIPPLSPRVGLAARGSSSTAGTPVLWSALDRLILRRISAFEVAPAAASLGDCAMVSRGSFISATKYESSVSCSESYSPSVIPGVTGMFVRDGRRPG